MKSSFTKTFRKRLNDLPTSVHEQAAKALRSGKKIRITPALARSV